MHLPLPRAWVGTVAFLHNYNYNETLKRYDSSHHTLSMLGEARQAGTWNPTDPQLAAESEWERLATTLCRRYGIDVGEWQDGIPGFATQVDPDVPSTSTCGDVQFDETGPGGAVDFSMQTEVFFLINKSESMGTVEGTDFDFRRSRLDSAKNAAREFFIAMTMGLSPGQAGPRVGLMYYDQDIMVLTPTAPTCNPQTNLCAQGTCESGECIAPCTEDTAATDCESGVCYDGHCLSRLRFSNSEVGRAEFQGATRMRGESMGEYPTAGGRNYEAKAIRSAAKLFGGAAPGAPQTTKVILDITDGLPNLALLREVGGAAVVSVV